MIKELNTLVMDNKDKRVDEDFIYDAYDIIRANNPELKPFLSQIHVEDECERDPFTGGEYYTPTGDIIFYLKPLDLFDVEEEFRHYIAIRTIDHEVEHARMIMNYLDHKNDIESTVVSYTINKSEFETYSGLPEFKHNCYMYDPQERIANIRSTRFIVNLLKNRKTSESLILARTLLLNAYERGYKNNRYYLEAPTYKYLIKNDMMLELSDLMDRVEKENYSFDTRLLCGLPITYEEEKSLSNKARVRVS